MIVKSLFFTLSNIVTFTISLFQLFIEATVYYIDNKKHFNGCTVPLSGNSACQWDGDF